MGMAYETINLRVKSRSSHLSDALRTCARNAAP